jgi:hypothetical protein
LEEVYAYLLFRVLCFMAVEVRPLGSEFYLEGVDVLLVTLGCFLEVLSRHAEFAGERGGAFNF